MFTLNACKYDCLDINIQHHIEDLSAASKQGVHRASDLLHFEVLWFEYIYLAPVRGCGSSIYLAPV